jgi:hypothetical protein
MTDPNKNDVEDDKNAAFFFGFIGVACALVFASKISMVA